MNDLFVITSPLQYLNALEARAYYQIAPSSAVLVIIPNRQGEESMRQLQQLLVGSVWGQTFFPQGLPPRGRWPSRALRHLQSFLGALKFRREVDALLARMPVVTRIFLGDWRARSFRYFLWKRPDAKVVLLDDGSVTSQAFRYRNDSRDPKVEAKAFPERNPKPWLAAGVRFRNPQRITFFTSYDLPTGRRDDIERHSFEALKADSASWIASDEVWFIGSNHAENGIASQQGYLAVLLAVRHFFSDRRLRYFAHRGESEPKLQQLEILGFAVARSELPLEIVIRDQKTYPRAVGAIASSVIDNLAAILGAKVAVYLFIVPKGYYLQRAKHLADIVKYHLEASGGNLFAIPVSHVASPPEAAIEPRVPTIQVYDLLTRTYASVSAYGAHSTDPQHARIQTSFSGITFQSSKLKNTAFATFLRDMSFHMDAQLEPTWAGTRTVPVLRSAPCPARWGRRHWILFEGPSQNLMQGDIASAELIGCTLHPVSIAHDIVSPSGASGATKVTEDTTTGPHSLTFVVSELLVGADYCFSIYVKRAGRERVTLSTSAFEASATFHLQTADVTTDLRAHGQSPTIQALNEQWYRLALPFHSSAPQVSLTVELLAGEPAAPSPAYAGDGISGIYLYGAQLSTGVALPLYLPPTRGAPRTRPGDSLMLALSGEPFRSRELVFLRVHYGVSGPGLAPLLSLTSGDQECFRVQGDPERLALFEAGVPAQALTLAADSALAIVVIQVVDGSPLVIIGCNGSARTIELARPLSLGGHRRWALGQAHGEYYRFMVEEFRIAAGEATFDEVAMLSTLPQNSSA